MKINYCAQHHPDGTPTAEWLQGHVGRASASMMASVMDFTKAGVQGSKRRTYFREKLAERLTGMVTSDRYVSEEMRQGTDLEPLARAAYESQEGVMVDQIGYAEHDSIPNWICSPDGLVGNDGAMEAKCPKPGTHLEWILGKSIPHEHLPQLRGVLSVTKRRWIDFVSFCPVVPKPLQLMVIRFEYAQADIPALEGAVEGFNFQIEQAIEQLRGIVGPFDLPAAQESKPNTRMRDELMGSITDEDIEWIQGKERK